VASSGQRATGDFTFIRGCDSLRHLFLETLGEACLKTDWQVHAWCLMDNHFHVVLETPRPNLVEGMRWFLSVYTNRFNHRQKEFGHLFSGRYRALIVDGSGNGYLKSVCDYVHLNPVRAGLIPAEQPLQAYLWSSYPLYLLDPSRRPSWLRVDRLFGEWGIPKDSPVGREQFAAHLEARRRAENEDGTDPLRGWYVGGEEFRQELLEQVNELAAPLHRGPDIQEAAVAKAERILSEELNRLRWLPEHLRARRKGDPQKVRIALRLRKETTMTLAWIAARLCMGTPSHLACLLYRQGQKDENSENTLF
jgi:REP-associated tyrosine transposase